MVKILTVAYMHFAVTIEDDMRDKFCGLSLDRDETSQELLESIIKRGWIELLGNRPERQGNNGLEG